MVRPHLRRIKTSRGLKKRIVRRHRRKVIINANIKKIISTSSKKNQDVNLFKKIANQARHKGYNIPPVKIGKGPVQVENIDIPESFYIDGFTMPVEDALSAWDSKFAKQKGKSKYYIGIDDDATHENRIKAFSHELGHVHMVQSNTKPHTEAKADYIGADILNIPIKEFRKDIIFDQDFFKAGIQLPKKLPKKVLNRAKQEQA